MKTIGEVIKENRKSAVKFPGKGCPKAGNYGTNQEKQKKCRKNTGKGLSKMVCSPSSGQ